jgi:sugar phosphate isomerase/epimerase
MPTLIELDTLEETAALCRNLGLSFVELNMNLPMYQAEELDTVLLAELAREYGIYYTIHLDEAFNPCDFNSRVAEAYTQTALSTIEAAKELSVPVINMHHQEGIYFTLPDRKAFLFERYKEVYFESLRKFRDSCTAAIGSADIKICVENLFGWQKASFLLEGIDLLLESPNFALTLDIGHNAVTDAGDETAILHRGERLCHMHMHDAVAATQKNHLPLGEGELDILRYLGLAREHNCRVVLETKTVAGLRQSADKLREMGVL